MNRIKCRPIKRMDRRTIHENVFVAIEHLDPRGTIRRLSQQSNGVRGEQIVGVKAKDKLAARMLKAMPKAALNPEVLLQREALKKLLGLKSFQYCREFVRNGTMG